MKIRFQGFTFNPGRKITKKNYMKHLLECGEDGGDFKFSSRNRIFHLDESTNDDYFTGLFVTIKDHKKLCSLDGLKNIVVFEAESGEHLMDFNYFIIHKESHRGLYQHYHQSCSVSQFGSFMKHRYNDVRNVEVLKEMSANVEAVTDPEKFKRSKIKEYGPFLLSAEVKQEDLKDMLAELNRVSSFEYCYHSVEAAEKKYTPASSSATRVYQKVVYKNNSKLNVVVKGISSFIKDNGVRVGKIRGYDPDGVEKLIKLVDNPSYFAEYDFDDVVGKIEGKGIYDLKNNWVIKELLKVAEENGMEIVAD